MRQAGPIGRRGIKTTPASAVGLTHRELRRWIWRLRNIRRVASAALSVPADLRDLRLRRNSQTEAQGRWRQFESGS